MTNLTWVLSSCVLILAVIATRAAFGKRMRPGLRYALWGLVLLRLLYPGTVLSSPVSVQGVAEQSEVVRNFEVLRGVDTIEYMDIDSSENSGYIVCPKREGMSLEWGTPERFERMQTTLKVRDVLEPIWFAGIAITSIVFLVSNLRFYAQLRKRRKPLETDCPLRVYSVENLSSSCLFGNSIYVAAETAADEAKLRHVLAHELSHHQHGDHVWALLRCVALALHWYNPLVWWAAALSRQDSELCADAGALERLGEAERENYGATLIELSARRAPRASLLCAATTMTNGKKSLKERVTMIARRPRMTVAVVIVVVLIAAVAAGGAFAGAAARENEATTDETKLEAQTDAIHTVEAPDEWATQLDLISAACDTWKAESEQDAWAYAVVDLDQNGRLEIIATENHGTGHFNTTRVWEVSATFDALVVCPMEEAAPATLEPNNYYDAERGIPQVYEAWYAPYNGRIFYIVDDGYNENVTFARSFIRSVWLEDGKFGGIELASEETDFMRMSERDPAAHLSYFDRQGGAITAEEYEAIGRASYGRDCVPYQMQISWIVDIEVQEMNKAGTLRGALENSFNGFALVPLSASGNLTEIYMTDGEPISEAVRPTAEELAAYGIVYDNRSLEEVGEYPLDKLAMYVLGSDGAYAEVGIDELYLRWWRDTETVEKYLDTLPLSRRNALREHIKAARMWYLPDWWFALLSGGRFLLADENGTFQPMTLDATEIQRIYGYYGRIAEFAALDLNQDGEIEIVLRVINVGNDSGGFIILHCEDHTVYGYQSNYRTFWELKTDGTFRYSEWSGSDDGYARARFADGRLFLDKFIRATGEHFEPNSFFVDSEPVSLETYLTARERQVAKPDAIWYEFTSENVETVLGNNEP